ncbi:hypothetical protein ID144_22970 [Pseudomonas sp. JM0905a]|nr:hypothetical protein [Pseudomonas sp. JM0905a]MBD2839908.1 hypothetical protein [Pseudomonas sp. JM0905a]
MSRSAQVANCNGKTPNRDRDDAAMLLIESDRKARQVARDNEVPDSQRN